MPFNIEVLRSEESLKKYFHEQLDNAVAKINSKVKMCPKTVSVAHKIAKLAEVILLTFALVILAIPSLISKEMQVLWMHCDKKADAIWCKHFRRDKHILARAANQHDYKSKDVYLQPNIPADSNRAMKSGIRMFREDGMCVGASLWFLSLYTHADTQDEKTLIFCSRRFKYGIESAPAMLQEVGDEKLKKSVTKMQWITHLWAAPDLRYFKCNMSDGTYRFDVPGHAMALVKKENVFYLFDPNCGLRKYAASEFKTLKKWIENHYPKSAMRSDQQELLDRYVEDSFSKQNGWENNRKMPWLAGYSMPYSLCLVTKESG